VIRTAALGVAALGLAAPVLAAEGGPIRGGEHDGFTRIVLTVEPTTEWSLETADGRATLRFPGRQLVFATDAVFDRIPRTRVTAVTATSDPAGARVTLALGCDCRVSTSFVGARYLALDVADRDAAPAASDQVIATTVYDRDTSNALATGAAAPPPDVCLEDARLDVGGWSNGLSLTAQLPDLSRRLVGEFDAPDPAAVRDLARLYLRYGFGAEAGALLAAFSDAPVEDRPLLADLSRAIEGRALAPDGPLSVDATCPGNHGLWLALAGPGPAWRGASGFASAQAAFGLMPPDLRLLLAPPLIDRLLAAGRAPEARLILDTAARPGEPSTPELDLAAARITAAEGRPAEAAGALGALIEGDGHASAAALVELARVALDARLPIPDRLVTDLRAAALQYRGAPEEADLRRLLIAALAARAELPAALDETRRSMRDLPAAAPAFGALMVGLLAAADPAEVGPAAYAETALAARDLLDAAPPTDPARIAVGNRLVRLGLPDPALAIVAPAAAAGEEAARLVAAEAELGRGDGAAARAALGPLATPEAAAIRARAFALAGAYGEAASTLANNGMAAEAAPYAWPSGDWPRARAAADAPTRQAMASYMEADPARLAAPDPAALTPELAFDEPLPPLDRPSLDAARRLLSAGGKIGGFVENVLSDDAP
jgi:hypothetical protein